MDFNHLFETIKEMSGDSDIVLNDLRLINKKIYVELDLVEPVNEELQKLIKD